MVSKAARRMQQTSSKESKRRLADLESKILELPMFSQETIPVDLPETTKAK